MHGFLPNVVDALHKFFHRHSAKTHGRKIAVFDADGTLWRGDIGEAFFRDQVRQGTVPLAPKDQDPWDVYFRETIEGDAAKAFGWLAQWNAGVREGEMKKWCRAFAQAHLQQFQFKPMQQLTQRLGELGFETWVVTGSMRWVVQAALEPYGIDPSRVIGTSVMVRNGKLTDELEHPVPYRASKAQLIETIVAERPRMAAGNTFWDKEMLLTATELAMAIHSEHQGEPNFESEQKLKAFVDEQATRAGDSIVWLTQNF